jgi:hypothetical protein
VLSGHEKRVWEEITRFWAEDAEEPPRPRLRPMRHRRRRPRSPADLPAVVLVAALASVVLLFLGTPMAGLAVGAATVLGWALWHYWPALREQGGIISSSLGEPVLSRDDGAHRRRDEPGHGGLHRMPDDG